jgi:glutamine amidotransferase
MIVNPTKVVIVDYGMGNIRSVHNALARLGCSVTTSDKVEDLKNADALVLPGVGAFGEAVSNLTSRGLVDPLIRLVREDRKPLLGICLGMQLLADTSCERGVHKGLGLIPGEIQRIEVPPTLRLPHVGWNSVHIQRPAPLFSEVPEGGAFYFVHSYHFVCNPEHVAATTDYGGEVVAAVQKDRVYGVQFHPERSQTNGLLLLANFVAAVDSIRSGGDTC